MKPSADTTAISVENVSHYFGEPGGSLFVQSLTETSLAVKQGELVSLIGPSGCGKTTLLNMMGGLLQPRTGTISVHGSPMVQPRPATIAFVFQEHALFPWNTIVDNIRIALKFQGVAPVEANDRARQAIETVGLDGFENHFPGQLSGGMRQRAALARALSLQTDIILMDEPFAALDEQTRTILGEDLSQLLGRTGKTIVFVTHSLGEAVFLSDRVAVFSARPGSIKEILSIDEPHPRPPSFGTSDKFVRLRTQLYSLLHDEIRKSMDDGLHARKRARDEARAEPAQ